MPIRIIKAFPINRIVIHLSVNIGWTTIQVRHLVVRLNGKSLIIDLLSLESNHKPASEHDLSVTFGKRLCWDVFPAISFNPSLYLYKSSSNTAVLLFLDLGTWITD